jgi:ATP-dependent Clp protease ATP-binding subunit ClpC
MLLRDRVRGDDVTERLLALLDAVDERVHERVAEPKERLLAQLSAPGFWERDDRFGVLAEAEYLDRLEEATRTAHRLADRLRGATQPHARQELRELLASRLYVLDRALAGLDDAAPFELFLRVRPAGGTDGEEATAFLGQVVGMYRGWARRHGMTIRDLAVRPDEALLAVSGLGAGMILRDEAGLHVFEKAESRDGDIEVERIAVGVEVAPAPPGEPTDAEQLARRARVTLDAAAFPGHVTRRYCFAPSPLVRDTVRGYRTGRIDRVLAGDFDLMV